MDKHTAIYVRVSSRKQDQASQLPDLERWAKGHDGPVRWYRDSQSGKTMERPSWRELESAVLGGSVDRVVVWRLDRLGRSASGLTQLFDDLVERKVGLVSLRDGIDLLTPAGRMMAGVLASVAQYETEVRAERIQAGIQVAKERGTRSGKPFGRPKGPGKPLKLTDGKREKIRSLKAEGMAIAAIARVLEMSRTTVHQVLAQSP